SFGSRDFQSRSFKLDFDAASSSDLLTLSPNELFCPDCQDVGIGHTTNFSEVSRADDSYDATQNLYAAYAPVETALGSRLKLLAGARAEVYQQSVAASPPWPGVPSTLAPVERTDVDILPAAQLVFELTDEMYLRGGYGQTVARPQARELAPLQ